MRTITFILAIALVAYTQALTSAQFKDYFLWSNANGDNNVVLYDGTVQTFGVQWVGLSAWFDLTNIAVWYKSIRAQGQIAYFHDYSLGDLVYNTRNISYSLAVNFSISLAKIIGNDYAFVNLDTEWDASGVAPYALSTGGIQSFKDRINAYRTYAPNAILSASAGLWTSPWGSSYNYPAFQSVDAMLNLRSTLYAAVSSDNSCTWRNLAGASSTSVFTDGKLVNDAVNIATKMNANRGYMNGYWGATTHKWFLADVAITDCGWGATGQASVVQNLVDALPTMFATGFRGMSLRNYSPPSEYRFMGQNNEAGFTWNPSSTGLNNTAVAVQNGLNVVVRLMKAASGNTGTTLTTKAPTTITTTKAPSTPTTTSSSTTIIVTKGPAWISNNIQISASPVSKITKITATFTDSSNVARTVTLTNTAGTTTYSGSTSNAVPNGAAVKVVVTTTSGSILTYTLYNTASATTTTTKAPSAVTTTASPKSNTLSVTSVSNAWNSWWLQVHVTPNTNVKSVYASFTASGNVKKNIALQAIPYTDQYMGSPTTQIPSGATVIITVTLKDNSVQSHTIVNTAKRTEVEEESGTSIEQKGWLIPALTGAASGFVACAVLVVVLVGILKWKSGERLSLVTKRRNTLLSPTGDYPASPNIDGHEGEEMVEIRESNL